MNCLEDEVLNLVIEYDVNGDGTIDFDEFLEMMKKQAEHQVKIIIYKRINKKIFKNLSKNQLLILYNAYHLHFLIKFQA